MGRPFILDSLLSEEEVITITTECREKTEIPYYLIPKIAALGICGDIVKG